MAARTEEAIPEPMEVDEALTPGDPAARPNTQAPPWAILRVDASTTGADVEAFLGHFSPAQCTRADFAWISVTRTDQPVAQGDPHTMSREWQWLCHQGAASATELDRLGRIYNVLSGKWMVFCPTAQVEAVWQPIAQAVAAGWLGPSAKVSPRESGRGEHVICVYVTSYLDRDAVQRVRHGLRQLGHVKTLLFKPDAFTYCGICANNPWGIKPNVFSE